MIMVNIIVLTNLTINKMSNLGVENHKIVVYNYLKSKGFSEDVCNPVKLHVDSKRFLVGKDPEYHNMLSEASKKTLEYQGGKMNLNEITNFESEYEYKTALKIRKYDDMGKENKKYTEEFKKEFFEKMKQLMIKDLS